MKIVCTSLDGFGHYLVPVRDGEDRNMVGKSKPMTTAEFRQWMEQKPVFPNKPGLYDPLRRLDTFGLPGTICD